MTNFILVFYFFRSVGRAQMRDNGQLWSDLSSRCAKPMQHDHFWFNELKSYRKGIWTGQITAAFFLGEEWHKVKTVPVENGRLI